MDEWGGGSMSGHPIKRLCPVCRRLVDRTPMGKIAGHMDKAHNICPAGFESYAITVGTA